MYGADCYESVEGLSRKVWLVDETVKMISICGFEGMCE